MTSSNKSLQEILGHLYSSYSSYFLILLNRSDFGLHINLRVNLLINIALILLIIDTQIDMQITLFNNELRKDFACQHTRDVAYQKSPYFAYQ